MNANSYPPINVLSVFRGVQSQKLKYHITPYRFEKQNGQSFIIEQIRHFHRDRKGKGQHFHYIVATRDDRIFRIVFDTNTFTWRLIQEQKMGESEGFKEDYKKV